MWNSFFDFLSSLDLSWSTKAIFFYQLKSDYVFLILQLKNDNGCLTSISFDTCGPHVAQSSLLHSSAKHVTPKTLLL
ncbi:unnamed protein product [Amoebophrya sp. A25]|nr:unnamed protein product [Amoebophrya sp. A25]|eukprot:GSA25T00027645001.1